MDELTYIIEPDDDIYCLDGQEFEEYLDTHQNMDFEVYRVREDVVNWIQNEVQEENAQDWHLDSWCPKQWKKTEKISRPEQDDIKALAFMTRHWGDLYMEVLVTYTGLLQGGMRPISAAYAALTSWDISLENAP